MSPRRPVLTLSTTTVLRGDYFYVETFGSGAAFLDYDGDGWQDIYLVNSTYLTGLAPEPLPTDKLYRNRGDGRFDAAPGSGDSGYGTGVAAADWDNDGDQDLYVTRFGPNALYRNDAGKFTDSDSAKRGGVDDGRWGASCGFLDYDLDGDLDLFVVNYVDFTRPTTSSASGAISAPIATRTNTAQRAICSTATTAKANSPTSPMRRASH